MYTILLIRQIISLLNKYVVNLGDSIKMGHFAKVLSGVVTNVIVAEPEFFDTFVDSSPGEWIQTSYNTRGNVHYMPDSNTPSGQPALRGNYAGIGYTYDRVNDVFIPPCGFASWTLDTTTWTWEPPVAYPTDGKLYNWNETIQEWALISGI
jgi:hypothetical protein